MIGLGRKGWRTGRNVGKIGRCFFKEIAHCMVCGRGYGIERHLREHCKIIFYIRRQWHGVRFASIRGKGLYEKSHKEPESGIEVFNRLDDWELIIF